MESLEKIRNLVQIQSLFRRKLEIFGLFREEEKKLVKFEQELKELNSKREDIEIIIKELDTKLNEELGKRDEYNSRIQSLNESKDKLKVARQLKSWEKEMEKMETERRMVQSQIEYDTSKQLERKNERDKLVERIDELETEIAAVKEQINLIKEEHREELESIEQESERIKGLFEKQFIDYFDTMLEKTQGNAIVPVNNDTCSGCNIILPTELQGLLGPEIEPQDILLAQCPHCSRYLYVEEWIEEEVEMV